MTATLDHPFRNYLLRSLRPATLKRLQSALEPTTMVQGETLSRVGEKPRYLYFVDRGLISLTKTMSDGRGVEIGAVGIGGTTDSTVLFGIDPSIADAVVQIPGDALRIEPRVVIDEMARDGRLRRIMGRYAHFALGQMAQTAACNRLHLLQERCCRWLLVAQDNMLSETLPLTHEFLAALLGVRRAGVSLVANFLQTAGVVRYSRGHVTITDRGGLEAAACDCYDETRDRLFEMYDLPAPGEVAALPTTP